jgi:D-glycero-alpha-D-manno-heptose-7-phosphate kinase
MNKIILSKTPLRVTFFGGGTDYKDYFKFSLGKTLSAAINLYSYVLVKKLSKIDKFKFRLTYYKKEKVTDYKKIKHSVFKAVIKLAKLENERLEIQHFADLPAFSGIGSSSAFTISLINALYYYKGIKLNKRQLAEKAILVERKILKESGGIQDQYTCSYGSLCLFNYYQNKVVKKKIVNANNIKKFINNNFLLLYTEIVRDGTKLISKQKNMKTTHKQSLNYAETSLKMYNNKNIENLSHMLKLSWEEKKKIPLVTNSKINNIYNLALKSGALGGKIIGAGGGGFFLFLVKKSKQSFFKKKMKRFLVVNFKISEVGSKVKNISNYL